MADGVPVGVGSAAAEVFDGVAGCGACWFNLSSYRDIDRVHDVARRHSTSLVLSYLTAGDAHAHAELDPRTLDLTGYFGERLAAARAAGVAQPIIDPGLGFYFPVTGGPEARLAYQLSMYLRLHTLRSHGVPVLVTLVQASTVFHTGFRRLAEPVLATLAMLGGASIIRAHEVAAVDRVRVLLDRAPGI